MEHSIDGGSLTPEHLEEIMGGAVPIPVAHAVVSLELTRTVKALIRELVTPTNSSPALSEGGDGERSGSEPADIVYDLADYFVAQNWILIRHVAELLYQFDPFDCPIPATLVRDARQETHLAASYALAAMLVTCEVLGRPTRGGGLIVADSLVPKIVGFASPKTSSALENAIAQRTQVMAGPGVKTALQPVMHSLVEFRRRYALGTAVERDIVRCVLEADRIVESFAGPLPIEVARELERIAYTEAVRLLAADYATSKAIAIPLVDPDIGYDALKNLALAHCDERAAMCGLGNAKTAARVIVQSNWLAICRASDIVRVRGMISGEKVRELLRGNVSPDTDLAA